MWLLKAWPLGQQHPHCLGGGPTGGVPVPTWPSWLTLRFIAHPRRLACTCCLRSQIPLKWDRAAAPDRWAHSVTVAPAAVWLLCLPQLEEFEGGQERGSWRQAGRGGEAGGAERWHRDKPHVQGWRAGGLGKADKRQEVWAQLRWVGAWGAWGDG